MFDLFADHFVYTAEDSRANLERAKEEDARRQAERAARKNYRIIKSGAGGDRCFTPSTDAPAAVGQDSNHDVLTSANGEMMTTAATPSPALPPEVQAAVRQAVLEERARIKAEIAAERIAAEREAEANRLAAEIVAAGDAAAGRTPRTYTPGAYSEPEPLPFYATAEQAAAAIRGAADELAAGADDAATIPDDADAMARSIIAAGRLAHGEAA
jgi:hypothetical protein